jgi:ferric-dicitrate binding protein FerR (iron transport regulator)
MRRACPAIFIVGGVFFREISFTLFYPLAVYVRKIRRMKTIDAKKWLRLLLSGEIAPDSPSWQQLMEEDGLKEVRKTLVELKEVHREDLTPAREAIWRRVEEARWRGKGGRGDGRGFRWRRRAVAAAVVLPLLLAGAWWLSVGDGVMEKGVTIDGAAPVVTNNLATLVLGDGERLELASVSGDTAWRRAGATLSLDGKRALSYRVDKRAKGEKGESEWHAMLVPRRGEYQLTLADGTRVFLNSESTLRFPVSFDGGRRQVFLEGEGYFEVARSGGDSFVVTAGGADVRALGTRFNVSTHAAAGEVVATLVEGSVRVSARGEEGGVVLRPDEQASASAGGITVRVVDAAASVSWAHGRFCFDGATLGSIAGQLERWYDAEFAFEEEGLADRLFTGMVRREQSLEEVVEMIGRTTFLRFTLAGGRVFVSRE